jgi:energy-coupling factor transporter ATP-binding protein EcfA2
MSGSIGGVPLHKIEEMPDDAGRWLIFGPQGSGKSTLASTIGKLGKTLFIDLTGEKGVRAFRGVAWSDNIDIVRPASITAMDDIFWTLDKGDSGYKAVVIDSLTSVQKMAMRFLLGHSETSVREIKQGTAPADIRTWGQSLDIMVDTATFWYGLADGGRSNPMHVVMTAQAKITDDDIASAAGSTRTPDVQKGALSMVMATPDYVLWTEEEEDPDAIGDDTKPQTRHIVRFGGHPGYRTKARVPVDLRGKIPPILGRGKNPPDLADLSRVLRIGGAQAVKTQAKAPAETAS